MSTPVRIYSFHHAFRELAARLVDRIYEWFRLPSLEGILVCLRSRSVKGRKHRMPPDGKLKNKLVQLTSEKQTWERFDYGIWRFVEYAKATNHPYLELEGAAKRIRPEDSSGISKQLLLLDQNPKASQQP